MLAGASWTGGKVTNISRGVPVLRSNRTNNLLVIHKVNLWCPHVGLCPGGPGVVGEDVTLETPGDQIRREKEGEGIDSHS